MSLQRVFCLAIMVATMVGCGSSGALSGFGAGLEAGEDGSVLDQESGVARPPAVEVGAWGAQVARGPLVAMTDPGKLPELRVAGEKQSALPLEHTHVKAHLLGFVAQVEVRQTYNNPFAEPIEVSYVFPLPENSAVNAMHMQIGKRVVRANIEERGKAKRIYERAKRRGHTAALLEQERPNIFTQSVANIAPGEKIDVVVSYVQDLSYDAGEYEFVFPMVVGPRFIPGSPTGQGARGDGTYANTDAVPDASRITPPVLGKGERSGHDISMEIVAEHSFGIRDVRVPTHDVSKRQPADGSLHLTLAESKSIPNRDFLMRYRVSGREPIATLLTSGDEGEGYFALLVHPPTLNVEELVGRREIIFVVDISGSMSGVPIGMAKTAMRHAIQQLRPHDTFNIITFAGHTAKSFKAPRPANRSNIKRALQFLANARAGGGTYMADAVRDALSPKVAAGRHRYVFFMTDGYVGNEQQIFSGARTLVEELEGRGQRARVFGFGVGSSPNRELLAGLARAGNGLTVYASTREDPRRAVNHFFHYIDRAVLTNVHVNWGELGAAEMYPQPMGDLFASRPIIVHGRFRGSRDVPVSVMAKSGEKPVEIAVQVRKSMSGGKNGGLLGSLWARSKVQFLQEETWVGARPDAKAEITELGLQYDLVTRYTSFVAVDESRVVSNGAPRKVVQPVEVPEGVDGAMAGARTRAGQPAPPVVNSPQAGVMAPAQQAPGMLPQAPPPPQPSPMAPPSKAEADEEEPMDAAMGSTDIAVERSDRGCYCTAAGPAQRDRYGWLVLIGLIGLGLRRRGACRSEARRSEARR